MHVCLQFKCRKFSSYQMYFKIVIQLREKCNNIFSVLFLSEHTLMILILDHNSFSKYVGASPMPGPALFML